MCSGSQVPTRLEPRWSAVPRSFLCPGRPEGGGDRHPDGSVRQHGAPLAEPLQRAGIGWAEGGCTHRTAADLLGRAAQHRHHCRPDPPIRTGGLRFASWTLDRLVSYLSEQGIAMRRSRISEIFIREGLRWRQDETWFGARVDPDFAKKRGRSNSSTRRRQQAA